ncbi:MAG: 4Fe-4S dicluster domain-containing protein [Gemmatimonadetes bacterium]|nr:4Fe-4S dicluster domain-containing protein [Gemmatimonadota bacterium]
MLVKNETYILERKDFPTLLEELGRRGYRTFGPTVRDQAIVYDELESVDDLPAGWTEEQDGGKYELRRREDDALFGYVIGPDSWKKYLHPPRQKVFSCAAVDGLITIDDPEPEEPPMAFLGMRSCERHAIAVQDGVFLDPGSADPAYARRREQALFIAVNCTNASETCFCTSMNTGPKVDLPVDLNMTECLTPDHHRFTVRAGSNRGAEILEAVPTRPATEAEVAEAERRIDEAAGEMGRTIETSDLKDLLYANLDNPHWEDVGARCLNCANCTMVCPTCFCTTMEDVTDITGKSAERTRRWDSCFTWDFSYMHGGSVRQSSKSRYRQWMTHKLATWQDQFDRLGCIGCGRCITWCPVGIDLTKEVEAIRNSETVEEAHADN